MLGDTNTCIAPTSSRKGTIVILNVAEGETVALPIGGTVKVVRHDKRDGLTVVEGQNGRTLRLSSQTRVELGRAEARPVQLIEYERVLQAIVVHEGDPDEQEHIQAFIAARKVLGKYGVTAE